LNDVSHNEFVVRQSDGGSILASEHSAAFLLLEFQNFKNLLFLGVVAGSLNHSREEDGEVNRNRREVVRVSRRFVVHQGNSQLEGGRTEQNYDVLVLKLVSPRLEEALDQW
jgi:hypothetical protein